MKKLFSLKLWAILFPICAVLMVGVIVGEGFAQYYASQINSYFNCQTSMIVTDEFADFSDKQYYKPKFMKEDGSADKDALYAYDKEVARRAAAEGAVLLWNHNGALPLSDKTQTVNLFGGRSAKYYYVIDGSGGTRLSEHISLKDAFGEQGFSVNEKLWSLYQTSSYYGGTGGINETPWQKAFSDAVNGGYGIYVIARKGSEGADMAMTGSDGKDGNITALSQAEKDHIEHLIAMKQEHRLSKVILLLNTVSGTVQFDELAKYRDDIDACLWIGLGGTSGPDAVVDLVGGTVVPSGHLADTFVYNSFSAPATENFGDYDYEGLSAFTGDPLLKKLQSSQGTGDSTQKNLKYLVYQEGIYVGYRYYETRYEDLVLGSGNADGTAGVKNGSGAWDYAEEVAYPFGYGTSYTTFEQSGFSVSEADDCFRISVNVKNTGSTYSGKDVVQVYLQRPYTDYDKQHGIEQAAVNLAGYAKTKLLAPGETETVTVTVDKRELKTYDADGAGSYILEGGTYYLAAGEDAHDALNNILAAKGKSARADKAGNADMVHAFTLTANHSDMTSEYTGKAIVNRFDDVDINRSPYKLDKITYLSRSDWQGTYPSKVILTLSDPLLKALDYGKAPVEDEFAFMPEFNCQNGMNLFSLWRDSEGKELPYDHEMWDTLLDQTSWTEQTDLIVNAWCATQAVESVAAPATENRDGPAGLNYLPAAPVIGLGMCYPSENLLAASFSDELVYEIGVCLGEDNLACGFTFLYAPGADIHRSAFSGRNGEYYSEDGFLSGELCDAEVRGLQSNGSGAQIKHFALNDEEINRNGVCVWANEQSIREIYLKAFEAACASGRGEALSVMSGFNRVGALWTGAHHGMMTDVLRGEWGFIGFVQSDGNGYALMSNYVDGLLGGNDIFMCGGGKTALRAYTNSPTVALAMREATHRVLFALTRTSAMNGLSSNTKIKLLTPWWESAILGLKISFIVLTAATGAMLTASMILRVAKRRRRSEESGQDGNA